MPTRTRPGIDGAALVILALLLAGALAVLPVSAATQYRGTGPAFTATVSGTNEFVAGQDATIHIIVKNVGLNDMKQVLMGTIDPEDPQNTAKSVTIGLNSSGDAILVKTDPQMVGDIQGGNSVSADFKAKISSNATIGEYQLPLTLTYRYPKVMVQEQADVYEFLYNDGQDTLPLTIRIKPEIKVDVLSAVPEQVTAGSEGYLNLTIRNAGAENGTMAAVKLVRNGQSPIIPATSTVFIGDFPSGSTVTCRYKVSVSKDATNQTYPVDVAVSYTNREGDVVTSQAATVGIPVNAKPSFSIVSATPELPRGSDRIIDVRFRNDGATTVYSAQARIVQHSPITVTDDTSYLGDIAPGATATARFAVKADDTADPSTYSLDSTVRFRDASDTSLESDTIQVPLKVVPGATGIPGGLLTIAGGIIVVLILGCALFLYRQKKSR